MSKPASKANRDPLPKSFAELNAMHPLRPIRDEADYDSAAEVLDRLVMLKRLTKDQSDYLETLSVLVEEYDREHYAIDTSSITPRDMLEFFCEQNDMTASDLGELLGNRSLGSKLLRGERELSKTHIRKLCARFSVSADLFLPPLRDQAA